MLGGALAQRLTLWSVPRKFGRSPMRFGCGVIVAFGIATVGSAQLTSDDPALFRTWARAYGWDVPEPHCQCTRRPCLRCMPPGAGPKAERDAAFATAQAYIDCTQTLPKGCMVRSNASAGKGGLFASMFQVTAREWMCGFAPRSHYCDTVMRSSGSLPRAIQGHFKHYTDNVVCRDEGYNISRAASGPPVACLFQPVVRSADNGKRCGVYSHCDVFDPGVGWRGPNWSSPWWWGATQAYLFRLHPAHALAPRTLTLTIG